MSPEEAVKRVTDLIEASPDADDQQLRELLLKRAVQPFLADQLVILVPLAFSRAYFESVPMEKQYWNYFLLVDRKTRKEEQHRLDWNPFFCAAQGRARKLSAGSPPERAQVKAVAQRSSEYQAINNVLTQLPHGTIPQAVGTSPATVLTDLPTYGATPAYQSSVRFREAFGPASASGRACALAVNLVIDARHPLEEEIRHINECFLDWLARHGTACKQLVIAFETAPDQNQKIMEHCHRLLQQDLGLDSIIENLDTNVFLIDPATQAEKQFKLFWQPKNNN